MLTTAYVPLTNAYDVTSTWGGTWNTGQAWTSPLNALDQSLNANCAFSSGSATQSHGLALGGWSNLIAAVGDKSARIHALQLQFRAKKITGVATMRFNLWQAFFVNALGTSVTFTGTSTSNNTNLTSTFNTFTLGSGSTGDLLGFDAQHLGYTGNAEYLTVEQLNNANAVIALRFTGLSTPGLDVQVQGVRVCALYSSRTTLFLPPG